MSQCVVCPRESTHRLTNDIDVPGIPICSDHERTVREGWIMLATNVYTLTQLSAAWEREKQNNTPIVVGQVYEDCDKRKGGRQVVVTRVDEKYCYIRGRYDTRPEPRITRLLIRRMKPTSTGFRLISTPTLP